MLEQIKAAIMNNKGVIGGVVGGVVGTIAVQQGLNWNSRRKARAAMGAVEAAAKATTEPK